MRIPLLAGVALIIVGAFLFFGGSFTSSRDVLSVGDLTVTADESHSVQPWIAGLVLLAGVALVVVEVGRKA